MEFRFLLIAFVYHDLKSMIHGNICEVLALERRNVSRAELAVLTSYNL